MNKTVTRPKRSSEAGRYRYEDMSFLTKLRERGQRVNSLHSKRIEEIE